MITYEELEKVNYKDTLTIEERKNLVSAAVLSIAGLYDEGIFGMNEYMTDTAFIAACTDLKFNEKDDIEDIWKFIESSEIMNDIIHNLGTSAYFSIRNEIEEGVRYQTSVNPALKDLIQALTGFINNTDVKRITDEFTSALNELTASAEEEVPDGD